MEVKTLLKHMINMARDKYDNIEINGFFIDKKDIIFEEKVKMNCFYCGKYNNNWKCPPNIPDLNYKKMIDEFENVAIIYLSMKVTRDTFENVRTNSSVVLHKILLDYEKILWDNNCSEALSFIGGSCKLCKNGCGAIKCNNPYYSRSPVEALGINVIKTVSKYGIELKFPTNEELFRVGMLLW
ncbi:DUF2284 domain-containing protein [Clostridium butyricum]|uniref:DUF2284 domain-containing protein n=1 Tax=Clostridium butyricum TaxID=1492 RepID=UPI00223ADB2B|nr:DUF2284 domain-containing protein [Clostridium butyricum]